MYVCDWGAIGRAKILLFIITDEKSYLEII